MYEYVCEHIIPGCEHKERADTEARVAEKAREHLHEHHGMEYIDVESRLPTAIFRIPTA